MKILSVEFNKLKLFSKGKLQIDLFAEDRVLQTEKLYKIADNNIYAQNTVAFIGLNATGKTTCLSLLSIAISLVIENFNLNQLRRLYNPAVQDGTILKTIFFHDNKYYKLESTIGIKYDEQRKERWFFKEEALFSKTATSVKTKKDITDFTGENVTRKTRSELDADILAMLKEDDSMVIMVTKENGSAIRTSIKDVTFNFLTTLGDTPSEVLQVFDNNIQSLNCSKNREWQVKFKNVSKPLKTNNPLYISTILSSGTIKGQNIILRAIIVLRAGGYLIVDELENHFNRELVKMIINLFKSKKTNPHGACLIFSTHYAELLDYIDRKDCVYIFRKNKGELSATNYRDEVNRNDIKKSDMIISNALTGTAPQYESIEQMRQMICSRL